MKKLITICLFMAMTFTVNAQVKKTTATKTPVKKVANTETTSTKPAEQKGPTKEQTIEYIYDQTKEANNYFVNNKSNIIHYMHIIKSIKIEDCKLIIQVEHSNRMINKVLDIVEYSVSLKDIEMVATNVFDFEAYTGSRISLNSRGWNVVLKTISNKSLIEVNPIFVSDYSDHIVGSIINEKSKISTLQIFCKSDVEKLQKAFNHLRKLCGAPEPIDFGN